MSEERDKILQSQIQEHNLKKQSVRDQFNNELKQRQAMENDYYQLML
jgi:hypothetical protein